MAVILKQLFYNRGFGLDNYLRMRLRKAHAHMHSNSNSCNSINYNNGNEYYNCKECYRLLHCNIGLIVVTVML